MNKEAPYRLRAEQMRKKVDRKNPKEETEGLPSRNKVHGRKKQNHQWKVKYPMIRLLVLFFILLPITIYSAYRYIHPLDGIGKAINSSGGYRISLEENNYQEKSSKDLLTSGESDNLPVQEESIVPVEPKPITNDHTSLEDGKNTESTSQKILYHHVEKGDNLFRISLKYYQSQEGMEIIRKANNLQGDEVLVGQVLTIPITD